MFSKYEGIDDITLLSRNMLGKSMNSIPLLTRQSAQWGTYTPDQRYCHFLKSTKYVALTLEMAVVCYML